MPKGVEHRAAEVTGDALKTCVESLMPKGVEHNIEGDQMR